MAGYSGTPLAKKLGIKPKGHVRLVAAPDTLPDVLSPLPDGTILTDEDDGMPDLHLVFAKDRARLEARLDDAITMLPADGMVWLAWPKQSSGILTDLTREVVRDLGLAAGLVDVKVCAIDDVWSGLKFVVRVEDRDAWPNP